MIKDLDIFAKVGKATAHEEYVEFEVRNNQLYTNDESFVFNGILSVEFLKVLFFHYYSAHSIMGNFFMLQYLSNLVSVPIYIEIMNRWDIVSHPIKPDA